MRRRDLLIATAALVAVWQTMAWLVSSSILPGPVRVAEVLIRELPRGLGRHFLASAGRVAASMVIAVSLATPLGLILGQSRKLNQLLSPVVYVLYPIPKIVFLPLILLLLGIGNTSKVFIITLILFFQVLVVVRDEAATLRPELIHSVRSLGAGRRALFRHVYLPASLPAVLTALRLSVGTAVAVLYVAELFATRLGLGYYIYLNGSTLFNYRAMYAGILAMSLLGLGLYFLVDWLERAATPYRFVEQ